MSMRRLGIAFTSGILAFGAMAGTAIAEQPAPTTFVAVLDTDQETTTCPKSNSARGLAVFHVTDEAAGTVEWSLVANNLPGNITAAHIHLAPKGIAGGGVHAPPPTPCGVDGDIAAG